MLKCFSSLEKPPHCSQNKSPKIKAKTGLIITEVYRIVVSLTINERLRAAKRHQSCEIFILDIGNDTI